MGTQWGQDQYGSGSDQHGAYGSPHDPYGSPHDPYAAPSSGASPYGASSSGDSWYGDSLNEDSPLGGPGFGPELGGDPYGGTSSGAAQHGAPQVGTGAPAPQMYMAAVPMAPPSSGLGIAGFVLGLLSLTVCGGITGPFGLVLSILGMRETAPGSTPPKSGRGLAIAGLVLSILGTLMLLAFVAYVVFVFVLVGTTAGSGS